jgi:hypothetical protein
MWVMAMLRFWPIVPIKAAIILKVESSAPSDASTSSASKMKPGALAPGTRNLPSSKRSTAAQVKGAVMA